MASVFGQNVDGLSRSSLVIARAVGCHRAVADALDIRTLAQAPELAAIAALDEVLVIVVHALAAEHATLDGDPDASRHCGPPTLREARRLVRDVRSLRRAVARYRRAVLAALTPAVTDEELPF
jgi:hypothetical protein